MDAKQILILLKQILNDNPLGYEIFDNNEDTITLMCEEKIYYIVLTREKQNHYIIYLKTYESKILAFIEAIFWNENNIEIIENNLI